jgi:hypothetical protein
MVGGRARRTRRRTYPTRSAWRVSAKGSSRQDVSSYCVGAAHWEGADMSTLWPCPAVCQLMPATLCAIQISRLFCGPDDGALVEAARWAVACGRPLMDFIVPRGPIKYRCRLYISNVEGAVLFAFATPRRGRREQCGPLVQIMIIAGLSGASVWGLGGPHLTLAINVDTNSLSLYKAGYPAIASVAAGVVDEFRAARLENIQSQGFDRPA